MNEVGYGRFSTEDVALRASVSRGALTHQFPSRNALIIAAFHYLIFSWEENWLLYIEKNERRLTPDEVTDFLWDRLFQSDNYIASLEIMLASRNDDELGNGVSDIMVRWAASRDQAISKLLGVPLERPETDEFIQLSLHAVGTMGFGTVGVGYGMAHASEDLEYEAVVLKGKRQAMQISTS